MFPNQDIANGKGYGREKRSKVDSDTRTHAQLKVTRRGPGGGCMLCRGILISTRIKFLGYFIRTRDVLSGVAVYVFYPPEYLFGRTVYSIPPG